MLVKYFDGEIKQEFIKENDLFDKSLKTIQEVKHHFDYFEVAEAASKIIELVDLTNKYVTDNAPWTLAKEEKMLECGQVLYNVLEAMRHIAIMLSAFCPNIATDIMTQLNEEANFKYENLVWGGIKPSKITEKEKIKPVFLRLDSEFATDKKKGQ
jgi:methionyl-tRNA synthetase